MPAREAEPPVALDWPICAREGCIGVQLEGQECCLAHVDDTGRASFLDGLKPEAVVDLRGTPLPSGAGSFTTAELG